MIRIPSPDRRGQTPGEEIANSVSHGAGVLGILVGTPFLIEAALARGGARSVVGAAVFAFTVLLLYLASTLYHCLPHNRAKRVFQVLDHSAIFLLIAGTYTPFTLGALHGAWGWSLFGCIWGLAAAGLILVGTGGMKYHRLNTGLYIGMGWLVVVAVRPLWLHVPLPGLLWLLAGGLAYTVGVVFYTRKGLRFGHFVWHLFVLAGTTCHFFAVLGYAG